MFFLALPVMSTVLFAAHLFYHGYPAGAAVSLLLLGLLAVPRSWARRGSVAAMAVIALEWVRSAVVLGLVRSEYGMPWGRACAILAAVAVFGALSAAVFFLPRVKRYYRID